VYGSIQDSVLFRVLFKQASLYKFSCLH